MLTNSVYSQCDMWTGMGCLTQYTTLMQDKVSEQERAHDKVRKLWNCFQQLQQTDFNKKVEKYKPRMAEFETTSDWFKVIMKDIHHDINQVIAQVALQMKENKQSGGAGDNGDNAQV
jgi:uncharacterized membrane-anchored protein YjiN (DUF445 family)